MIIYNEFKSIYVEFTLLKAQTDIFIRKHVRISDRRSDTL